jgi:hypothetical protein
MESSGKPPRRAKTRKRTRSAFEESIRSKSEPPVIEQKEETKLAPKIPMKRIKLMKYYEIVSSSLNPD